MSKLNISVGSQRWIFGVMAIFAFVGLVSAFVLSVEKLELLRNPDAVLSCSLRIVATL